MTNPTTQFSVRLPAGLLEALDAEAERLDRSRTWLVRKAVESFLTDDPRMVARAGDKVTRQLAAEAVSTEGHGS